MASVNNHETQINNINNTRHRILAQEIPNNADLNNYTTSGFYRNPMNAYYIINSPCAGSAFNMIVETIQNSSQYITQTVNHFNSAQSFKRYFADGSWTGWFRIWMEGNSITNAVWNDYAERFEKPVDLETEPGDIIALDKSTETEMYKLAEEGDSNIVGVHSDEYGMLIGGVADDEEYNKEHFIPVGMIGRVRTKIIGPIHKGDRIVPSNIPGVGRIFENGDNMFAIVGFATETNLDPNIKKVRTKINTY